MSKQEKFDELILFSESDKRGEEHMFEDEDSYLSALGKWGYKDETTGKIVIPEKYDNAERFEEGLAAVRLTRKWGFIDMTGKEVIPLIYNWVSSFKGGEADVQLGEDYFCIDKNGNRID
jgi:hypothetical protein